MSVKITSTLRRKLRVRKKIKLVSSADRPRLIVFRSNKNISAQLVDVTGSVLAAYSSLALRKAGATAGKKGVDVAVLVGSKVAELSIAAGVKKIVFDKGSYLYSGRIKALADACRKSGLQF